MRFRQRSAENALWGHRAAQYPRDQLTGRGKDLEGRGDRVHKNPDPHESGLRRLITRPFGDTLKPDRTADGFCSRSDADIFGVDDQIILGGIGNVRIKIFSDKRAAV
jgi:hypothetical protein